MSSLRPRQGPFWQSELILFSIIKSTRRCRDVSWMGANGRITGQFLCRRLRMNRVTLFGELLDPTDDVRLREQRCMALIRDHQNVHVGMTGLHGFDRLGTQD